MFWKCPDCRLFVPYDWLRCFACRDCKRQGLVYSDDAARTSLDCYVESPDAE